MPRLLPLTILAMGGSLLLHGVHLARGWLGPVPDELAMMVPAARAEGLAKPTPPHGDKPHGDTPHGDTPHGDTGSQPTARLPGAAPAASPPTAPAALPVPAPGPPPVSDSERALLQDLRARRGELEQRAAGVAEREGMLSAAEKRLDVRLNELTDLQHRLEQLDAARKQREEADWQGMVKVYETMKPRDAAAIFNDLDLPVLLQVLDRMKAAKAAVVLGAMQPERARQVTAQLAQLRIGRESVPGG